MQENQDGLVRCTGKGLEMVCFKPLEQVICLLAGTGESRQSEPDRALCHPSSLGVNCVISLNPNGGLKRS